MIKNDEIEVSFVVTIFNKEKFIKNMVNSLKSQEGLFSREYVFVNDGSTDRSMAILKEETKNLDNCHIISQKNSGPSNATNNGVKSSHGKWIKIVDADDVLLKKSTKFLLHLLNKYNLDGLYGKQYKRIENDKINGISCNYNNNIDIKRIKITDIAKKGLAGSSQIIFKRDIFLKSDGCYENVFCQDFSMALELVYNGNIASVDALISVAPENVPGRIMNNKKQMLHDINKSNLIFIAKSKNIGADIKRKFIYRIIGRCAKWRKREENNYISYIMINILKLFATCFTIKVLVKICKDLNKSVFYDKSIR